MNNCYNKKTIIMENKFRRFLVHGTLLTGGAFFVVTFVIYHVGCSERTLVYWSLMTVFMCLVHIVLKLSYIELEQVRIHEDIMEAKLMLVKSETEKSLKRLEDTLNEAEKKLHIKKQEEANKQ